MGNVTGDLLVEPRLISFLACLESQGFKPVPLLQDRAGGVGLADVWHQHRIPFPGIPALLAPGWGWRSWKGLEGIPSEIREDPGSSSYQRLGPHTPRLEKSRSKIPKVRLVQILRVPRS